jgi:eukaryotic-like serine/threonine-protein kinase
VEARSPGERESPTPLENLPGDPSPAPILTYAAVTSIITRVVRFAERFVLEREIGSGGMSRVFLGRDEILDRPVAVKILKSDLGETDIGARFRREGRTAAKLSHPNIVQVYDAGEGEFEGRETSFIVMEYVPGGDLKELIDKHGTLSGGYLTRLSGVAAGLAHAHERGVIHRDIKPHNILLDENGSPKLADFGIARALDATTATRTGSYLGTALYSSPEQLRGEGVTPKSDVYSLGIALYHAATGQVPFVGSPIEVANQHVFKEPIPPRELNDAVSASLEALILDCLKKDPDSRPTADEVRLGLVEAGQGAHATQANVEAPVTGPTEPEHTRAAPTEPRPAATLGRPAGATYGGRRRWARGALMALAFVALLAVIGALAAPTFLGGGDGGGSAQSNRGPNPSGGDQAQGGQNPQGGAAGQQSPEPQGQGSLTPEAAERTVEEFYTSSSAGNYDRSAQLLSESWRQSTFPDRATFEATFDKVESVEFIEGPNAEVSGDTATVTGRTRATLIDQIEQNEGTWRLVKEGGEWRIDGWNVNNLSTRPA